jgi:hypothetical protein
VSIAKRCGLGEHANDDPEESGDLWHPSFESQEPVVLSFATIKELSSGFLWVNVRIWIREQYRPGGQPTRHSACR